MLNKPLIGLNADYRSAKGNQPAFSLITAGYYDHILHAGGIPVIVPPQNTEDDIHALLDRLDGFVLIGGADLDPRRDGFMLHSAVKPLETRREVFDRQLARIIAERKLPVFGIGVGMQLLNVTMGGNLFLHIPEDLPNALPHRDPLDPSHRHGLLITPGSLMDRVYGDGEIRVNSRHHMAIDEVAHCFNVTARCADGVVEAIESNRPDWLAIGTQFHPESEARSALDVRIFEEFVDAVRERQPVPVRMAA
ncbi:MAG TPA: gamma-glutamyl-gamma-aminobutyrate hydrolase family protein [Pirellulaceae bacterium]|nr:gamma-glutamyl-gamma-aminobutyrate hydrolase family protein [Pirellulaceae bacterium]